MFFDVGFERNERGVNEVRYFLIRVGLSFQPSTCASCRRRRKIDQYWFAFPLRLLKRSVGVFDPIDEHGVPPVLKLFQLSRN